MHTVVGREAPPMRWIRWTRVGFALLAPVVVAVMLAAGEWSQPPASAQSDPKAAGAKAADGKAAPSEVAKPKGGASTQSTRPEHVRELQQALTSAGYDPG